MSQYFCVNIFVINIFLASSNIFQKCSNIFQKCWFFQLFLCQHSAKCCNIFWKCCNYGMFFLPPNRGALAAMAGSSLVMHPARGRGGTVGRPRQHATGDRGGAPRETAVAGEGGGGGQWRWRGAQPWRRWRVGAAGHGAARRRRRGARVQGWKKA
jgi:hypothetical protein